MGQAVRRGFSLSLGPISVATRLYSVIPSKPNGDVHTICKEHKVRIKQQYFCPEDGEINPATVKGVEVTKGKYRIYEEEAKPRIPADEGLTFTPVPAAEFHNACLPGKQIYYVELDGTGAQAWELLYRLAQDPKRVLVAKGALRENSPKLYRLTVFNDYLVLQEFVFPEHVRAAPAREAVTLSRDMLKVAKQFMDAAETEWSAFDASDDRRAIFEAWLEENAEDVQVTEAADTSTDNVMDLLSALRESVEGASKKKAG